MIEDCVLTLESTLEKVKGLIEVTQQSFHTILERLGLALALNVQTSSRYTPPIPASASQKKISLKPSLPLDFNGNCSASKAFLTSCQTYI